MQLIKIPQEQLADWQLTSPNPQDSDDGSGQRVYHAMQLAWLKQQH